VLNSLQTLDSADRQDRQYKVSWNSENESDGSAAEDRIATERGRPQRRRQIDPTTCERDYSTDEIEFMRALDEYKRSNRRMFPTCSEILEVVRSLGYVRPPLADAPTSAEASGAAEPTDAREDSDEEFAW
jgi:hypothetical protein